MGRRGSNDGEPRYPPGFAEALGRTIKVFRTDQGIERRDLAERVGISYSYLTEIENGNKPPSSSVLAPIAAALGLRMSQLIEATEARMDSQGVEISRATPEAEWARRFRTESSVHKVPAQLYAMPLPLRGPDRDFRAVVIELERLMRTMASEDVGRLLDYARRLAR